MQFQFHRILIVHLLSKCCITSFEWVISKKIIFVTIKLLVWLTDEKTTESISICEFYLHLAAFFYQHFDYKIIICIIQFSLLFKISTKNFLYEIQFIFKVIKCPFLYQALSQKSFSVGLKFFYKTKTIMSICLYKYKNNIKILFFMISETTPTHLVCT